MENHPVLLVPTCKKQVLKWLLTDFLASNPAILIQPPKRIQASLGCLFPALNRISGDVLPGSRTLGQVDAVPKTYQNLLIHIVDP